jgi:hypothetical protein
MKHLIFDTANILFRVAAGNNKNTFEDPKVKAALGMHMALYKLRKYAKKYKPDRIIVTFEGRDNWRKTYTKSDQCVSGNLYKGNRVKDPSMDAFFELIAAFEDLAVNHTSLVCLTHPELEGDDLFAGYVKRYAELGDEVIGISGDKDFVQLLKYKNFQLINPDADKPRTLIDVCGEDSADYFLFEKCIRGDKGDNVHSAYPNVRKTKLIAALEDDYKMTELMNSEWSVTDPETEITKVFRVGDLFKENQLLMDLDAQPDHIKALIEETIDTALANRGTFKFFNFQKFCGKFELKQIAEKLISVTRRKMHLF